MISRRNFFAMTTIMCVIFFMFQFSNVALEGWNNYEVNSHVADKDELHGRSDMYRTQWAQEETGALPRSLVVYIGSEVRPTREVAEVWSTYTKRKFEAYPSLEAYDRFKRMDGTGQPEMIVVDTREMDLSRAENCGYLEKYIESGIDLVFCNLPEASEIESSAQLKELLGIREVAQTQTTVAGLQLYDGFLLGGGRTYQAEDARQDMELSFPWYKLSSGTKTYMKGFFREESQDPEEDPAVIWRKSFGDAFVFAVNGEYMEDVTGLGLLSAMTAEMNSYEIYPVVNAQNMIYAGYPVLSEENGEEMMRRYNRSLSAVSQDIIWPNMVAISRSSKLGVTCMTAPQLDYVDYEFPREDLLARYLKMLNEQKMEAGLYGINLSNTPLKQKLSEDYDYMQTTLPSYLFTSFYAGSLEEQQVEEALEATVLDEVRTVVADYDGRSDLVGYQTETVTRQSILSNGLSHTFREDFRVRSVETALGYTSVLVNMDYVVYPASGDEDWDNLAQVLSRNIGTGWENFRGFAGTTASECDSHIRSFLALDYSESREEDGVLLTLNEAELPVWFVLRTQNEAIERVEGGSYKQLEEHVYLIEANERNVKIDLKSSEKYRYIYR